MLSEQTLAKQFQPYLPSPAGIWPLSKTLGPIDVSTNKIPTNESWTAYDSLFTPAGIMGSPMFTKELNHESFIQIFPGSKLAIPDPKQVTIMGWIRPDAINEGTFIVSYIILCHSLATVEGD